MVVIVAVTVAVPVPQLVLAVIADCGLWVVSCGSVVPCSAAA